MVNDMKIKTKLLLILFMTAVLAISIHFCDPGRLVPYIYLHRMSDGREYRGLSGVVEILQAHQFQYKVKEKEEAIVIYIEQNRRGEFDTILSDFFSKGFRL